MSEKEERVVQMKFDNADFEKGVQQTLNSLDKLDKSINDQSNVSSNKFDKLQESLNKITTSSVEKNIESLANRFSILGIAVNKVVTDITGKLETLGAGLAKTLSGIKYFNEGWSKYADKTSNVGTLVSQGYKLDTVNKQLEKLQWYTDETSYDFNSMVQNIGKFTASGQKLEDAEVAMEGIANWAASAGQNATVAQRAMYQLSQAMGKGVLKLDDYRSIQNASMDTVEFRQKTLDAAVALGTLKKVGNNTYQTLNKKTFTLSQFTSRLSEDGWLTSDVMMKVFGQYAEGTEKVYNYIQAVKEQTGEEITASEAMERLGMSSEDFGIKVFKAAQEARTFTDMVSSLADAASSSWSNVFENLFGDYAQAKALWTGFANSLYDYVTWLPSQINSMLSVWNQLGGREKLLQGILNILNAIMRVVIPIKQAFESVFTPLGEQGKNLYNLTDSFERFTEALKINAEAMNKIFAVSKVVFTVIKDIFSILTPKRILAIGAAIFAVKAAISFLNPTHSILRKIASVIAVIIGYNIVSRITKGKISIQSLINVLGNLIGKVTGVGGAFVKNFSSKVWNGINTVIKVIGTLASKIKSLFATLASFGKSKSTGILSQITSAAKSIKSTFVNLFNWITTEIGKIKKGTFNFADILDDIKNGFVTAFTSIFTFIVGIFSKIAGFLSNIKIRDPFALQAYAAETGEFTGNVKQSVTETAKQTDKLTESVKATNKELTTTSSIASDTSSKVGGIVSMFIGLQKSLNNTKRGIFTSIVDSFKNFNVTGKSSASVLDLITGALKNFVGVSGGINWRGLLGIGVLVFYISVLKHISKTIDLFVASISKMTGVLAPIPDAFKGVLNAISRTFDSISGYFNRMNQPTFANKLKTFAATLLMFAGALFILAQVPTDKLITATGVLIALTATLVFSLKSWTKLQNIVDTEKLKQLSVSMLAVSAATLVLTAAIKKMAGVMQSFQDEKGYVSLNKFLQFFASVAAALAPVLAFSVAIGILAALAPAVEGGAKSLLKMAGALISFAIAVVAMNAAAGTFVKLCMKIGDGIKAIFNALTDLAAKIRTGELSLTGDQIIALIETILLVAASLVGAGVLLNKVSEMTAKAGLKFGAAIAAIGLSLFFLAGAIAVLSKVGKACFEAAGYLAILGLMLTVFAAAINVLGKNDNIGKIALSLIGISASILLLTAAVKALSDYYQKNGEAMYSGFFAVALLLGGLTGVVKLLNNANIGKVAAGVLSLVAAMYLLLPLIIVYGNLDFVTMARGEFLICAGMLALAKSVQLMSDAKPGKIIAILAALTVTFSVFALVIGNLANSASWEQLAAAAGSVALGLLVMAGAIDGLITAVGKKGWKRIGEVGVLLLALVPPVLALGFALSMVAQSDPANILSSMAALSAAFSVMAVVTGHLVKSMNKIKFGDIGKMFLSLAAASGAMIAVAAALKILEGVDFDTILAGGVALSTAFIAMAGGIAVLTSIMQNTTFMTVINMLISLVAVSASMYILVGVIERFAAVDWSTLGKAGATLGVIVVALAALAIVFNEFALGAVAAIAVLAEVIGVLLSFSVAAVAVGAASLMISGAFYIFTAALQILLPLISEFLQSIAELSKYTGNIVGLAGALSVFALSLVAVGVGCAAAGVGLVALSLGVLAISAAVAIFIVSLTLCLAAFVAFSAAISNATDKISGVAKEALEWGYDLVANFAEGIFSGIKLVTDAIGAVVKEIWSYAHHSSPEKGPLAGNAEFQWGLDCIKNFCSGLAQGVINFVNPTMNDVTQSVGDNFDLISKSTEKSGEEAGTSFGVGLEGGSKLSLTSIGSKIQSFMSSPLRSLADWLASMGDSLGDSFGGNLIKKISMYLRKLSGVYAKGRSKFTDMPGYHGNEGSSGFEDFFNIDDFLGGDLDFGGQIQDSLDGATGSLGDFSGAADKAGKSAGGASSSVKDLAEKQKMLEKYTKYSTATMTAYAESMTGVAGAIGDTTEITDTAKAAIEELAETIYQESLTASGAVEDASMSAEDRAYEVKKAFVEAFEDIKESVSGALDMWSEFDNKWSDVKTPEKILKNVQSEMNGVASYGRKLIVLANKGFSSKVLKSIEDEGIEGISKVNSLLQFSTEQVEQYNQAWDQKDTISEAVAAQALSARVTTRQVAKLKEQARTQKGVNEEVKKMYETYLAAEEGANSGAEGMKEMAEQLKEMLQASADSADVSYDDLINGINDVDGASAQASLNIITMHQQAEATLMEYQAKYEKMHDTIKTVIDEQMDLFSKFDAKTDMTAQDMLDNMKSQIDGVTEWASNLETLKHMGLVDGLIDQLAQLGPKSYEQVHAFVEMSADQIQQANSYYAESLKLPDALANQVAASYTLGGEKDMQAYTDAMINFMNTSSGPVNQAMASFATSLTTAASSSMGKAGKEMADQMSKALAEGVTTASTTVSDSTKSLGEDAVKGAVSGVSENEQSLTDQSAKTADNTVKAAGDIINKDQGISDGENYSYGLAEGIGNGESAAVNAAASVAASAVSAAQTKLDINSPSKVMAVIGKFFSLGFANGISKYGISATDAATEVSQETVNTIRDALAAAQSIMDDDSTINPTITPVIDLSDVQNGIGLMSSMFNNQKMAIDPNMTLGNGIDYSGIVNRFPSIQDATNGSNNSNTQNSFGNFNFYITAGENQDPNQIADTVMQKINHTLLRTRAAKL